MWLCYGCDQDFNLFKAGKSIQKEIEGMRAEMNGKINEMLEAINNLKHEHQTRAVTKNKTAEMQQAMADEKQRTTTLKRNGPTEERSRP
jgi:Skp family chaperone for outer membrane proteins